MRAGRSDRPAPRESLVTPYLSWQVRQSALPSLLIRSSPTSKPDPLWTSWQVTQEIEPVSVTEPYPGVYVFDLGQNMVGWVRLRVRGTAGTEIRMRFGEMLRADRIPYLDNQRSARCNDRYILKGEGEEVFEPRFTSHGFRYVQVVNYPGKPDRTALTGRVAHSVTVTIASLNK